MKKILLITLIGISFGLKAQNVDLNNSTDYIRIQKNGESSFSRAFGLNSSNHMYIGSVEKTIGNIYFFNNGIGHLMTLSPNGNMGIGTTNPTRKLHIIGTGGELPNGAGGINLSTSNGGGLDLYATSTLSNPVWNFRTYATE